MKKVSQFTVPLVLCLFVSSYSFQPKCRRLERATKKYAVNDEIVDVAFDDMDIDRRMLKSKLFALSASCDRGFGASSKDRDSITDIVSQLKDISPWSSPTSGLFPHNDGGSAPIEGVWKMVYTSALDVLSLAANPVSQLQGIYQVMHLQVMRFQSTINNSSESCQVISADGSSVNVIDTAPRIQSLLPPSIVGL